MDGEKLYVCGNCGHRWFLAKIPEDGKITCPSCKCEGELREKSE